MDPFLRFTRRVPFLFLSILRRTRHLFAPRRIPLLIIIIFFLLVLFILSSGIPPNFNDVRAYERALPQHNLTFSSVRYLRFPGHIWGHGLNNIMQEDIMMAYLAYLTDMSFVFEDYTWSHLPLPYTLSLVPTFPFVSPLQPTHIPLNTFIAGPTAGGPLTPHRPSSHLLPSAHAAYSSPLTATFQPRDSRGPPLAVSVEFYKGICEGQDVAKVQANEAPHDADGVELFEWWVERLQMEDALCIEVVSQPEEVFGRFFFGSPRILSIWDSLTASPIITAFRWSPLVERALARSWPLLSGEVHIDMGLDARQRRVDKRESVQSCVGAWEDERQEKGQEMGEGAHEDEEVKKLDEWDRQSISIDEEWKWRRDRKGLNKKNEGIVVRAPPFHPPPAFPDMVDDVEDDEELGVADDEQEEGVDVEGEEEDVGDNGGGKSVDDDNDTEEISDSKNDPDAKNDHYTSSKVSPSENDIPSSQDPSSSKDDSSQIRPSTINSPSPSSSIPTKPPMPTPSPPFPFSPAPLPGLLAVHLRRGDYEHHCPNLSRWGAGYMGINRHGSMRDRFWVKWDEDTTCDDEQDGSEGPSPTYTTVDPLSEPTGWPGQDTPASQHVLDYYLNHCYPNVEEIVRRVGRVREEWASFPSAADSLFRQSSSAGVDPDSPSKPGPEPGWSHTSLPPNATIPRRNPLKKIYALSNGSPVWLAELKEALLQDGWEEVLTGADIFPSSSISSISTSHPVKELEIDSSAPSSHSITWKWDTTPDDATLWAHAALHAISLSDSASQESQEAQDERNEYFLSGEFWKTWDREWLGPWAPPLRSTTSSYSSPDSSLFSPEGYTSTSFLSTLFAPVNRAFIALTAPLKELDLFKGSREETWVEPAVEMAIAERAEVFVGNGFSSVTSNIMMLRMARGVDPLSNRFL